MNERDVRNGSGKVDSYSGASYAGTIRGIDDDDRREYFLRLIDHAVKRGHIAKTMRAQAHLAGYKTGTGLQLVKKGVSGVTPTRFQALIDNFIRETGENPWDHIEQLRAVGDRYVPAATHRTSEPVAMDEILALKGEIEKTVAKVESVRARAPDFGSIKDDLSTVIGYLETSLEMWNDRRDGDESE